MKFIPKIALFALLNTTLINTAHAASSLQEHASKNTALANQIAYLLEVTPNPDLAPIYAENNYRPIWVTNTTRYRALLNAISNADNHGLIPRHYGLRRITNQLRRADSADLAELELAMSSAFLAYATDMVNGRFSPDIVGDQWHISQPTYRPEKDLLAIAEGDNVTLLLQNLQPPFDAYKKLQRQLSHYRAMAQQGGWPQLTGTELLEPGDIDPEIAVLRQRLAMTQVIQPYEVTARILSEEDFIAELITADTDDKPDYIGPESHYAITQFQTRNAITADGQVGPETREMLDAKIDNPKHVFDTKLAAALKEYQMQHGLEPDGLLGTDTRRSLNISAAARLRQILLNMERYRWLPRKLGAHYLYVDIAGYTMKVVKNDRAVFRSNIIVGRPSRETPAFDDELRYLEFNPYWNIPATILYQDILPAVRKDPDYLDQKDRRILESWDATAQEIDPNTLDWNSYANTPGNRFPYRIRQEPGTHNALGLIKFMFPNRFSIYLHDTPHRELFDETSRHFSSGCIRVEKYVDLAEYILNETGINPDQLLGDINNVQYSAVHQPLEDFHPKHEPTNAFYSAAQWDQRLVESRLQQNQNQRVFLPQRLPVYIVYFTAWVDESGYMQFRDDIYNRDQNMQKLLKQNMPTFIDNPAP